VSDAQLSKSKSRWLEDLRPVPRRSQADGPPIAIRWKNETAKVLGRVEGFVKQPFAVAGCVTS